MKTNELREKYLAFFESKGHTRRPSDVLVPTWDPSVLFTPAGMNQFKDHFLGKVKLDFTRATTCQKCLRTGDIDNVGRTSYHHTFFEMLGNFSFGDYFKREAIFWAWEFCTDAKWLGLSPDRLSVTVYLDDDEAAQVWSDEVGLPASRITRMGEDDNFWPASAPSQGPDGVCGPCSEIFYTDDKGEDVEIWNLVFTQFNRVGDPPDNLRPLPSRNIDTGMGLERAAAALQGVDTNYHIDILRPIVEAAGEVCEHKYEPRSDEGRRLRRITDHVRACTFAVHENVYPGAQKEKYVIRRLLRRAVLDGHQLGRREPFLHQLVPVVVDMMKEPYPELTDTMERVAQVIRQEEESFFGTIDDGLSRINRIFAEMHRDNRTTVDGAAAADLYQTHGVPPELFQALAAEKSLAFDWDGFNQAMARHRELTEVEGPAVFQTGPIESLKEALQVTEFVGYEGTELENCVTRGIVIKRGSGDELSDCLSETDCDAVVVLDRSPFYAESGGQVGDQGELKSETGRFAVQDTQKSGDLILHFGRLVEGELRTGQGVIASVDPQRRDAIRRAHSATHMLHHALQSTLGTHAQQQGSKVDDDWLRFDFTNMAAVSPEQLAVIERDVRQRVADGADVSWQYLPLAQAREAGAMMLFGEKYPDPVRMVSMGDFSKELCGGTHLSNTREVGAFEVVAEEAVSSGTRRIVALTGKKAEQYAAQTRQVLEEAGQTLGVHMLQVPEVLAERMKYVRNLKKRLASGGERPTFEMPTVITGQDVPAPADVKRALREAARCLNVAPFDLVARINSLLEESADLERQLDQLNQQQLSADDLIAKAKMIGDSHVIVAEANGANPGLMRQLIDQIRKKTQNCAVLLIAAQGEDKVMLTAGVTDNLIANGVRAGDWVKEVAPVVGGGGGGKPDMAQAGGKRQDQIPAAITRAAEWVQQALGA